MSARRSGLSHTCRATAIRPSGPSLTTTVKVLVDPSISDGDITSLQTTIRLFPRFHLVQALPYCARPGAMMNRGSEHCRPTSELRSAGALCSARAIKLAALRLRRRLSLAMRFLIPAATGYCKPAAAWEESSLSCLARPFTPIETSAGSSPLKRAAVLLHGPVATASERSAPNVLSLFASPHIL